MGVGLHQVHLLRKPKQVEGLRVAQTGNRQGDTPGFEHNPDLVELLDLVYLKAGDPTPSPAIDGDKIAIQPSKGIAKGNATDAQLGSQFSLSEPLSGNQTPAEYRVPDGDRGRFFGAQRFG
tara:strand:- start:121 stop:483 length:363 start_codon:yes stop_codon:yes gene_type:complete